jgi:uncharacterized protein YyaL (SSP411 family)
MSLDRNTLGTATSPYLLQHRANPVHWQQWSPETLAAAAAAKKPILLSIGYAACHWCHVMAHESFEDEAIAALMNEHFVPIKVDREERPDLDAIYQHALALLGEHGGWPLTMFLTPAGEPFWGGTYFPPRPRFGRPGFPDVLRTLANVWEAEREKVEKNVGALREALARLASPERGGMISVEMMDRVAERLTREVDPFNGGIGDAPKFPQVGIFELLWRGYRRSKAPPMRDAVTRTLDRIAQGGIYDHLGGGFARYAVDPRWLVPHFEKMLYDNAQVVELMTMVWQETRSPLYEQRICETIEWLGREMTHEEGGFFSSLDADSEHEEGKFYVWEEHEIDKLLGPRSPFFKRIYDVTPQGNWEGKNILNRLHAMDFLPEKEEADLAADRAVLFHAREERVHPGLDDKILADWNGLMVAALAKAGAVFERPDWLDLACTAFSFVTSKMMRQDGRLSHAWREGVAAHPATLDDYANMGRAALALLEATGDAAYLAAAERWVAVLDRHYWDAAGEGYFFAADDTTDVIARAKAAHDGPVPSGNGTMVGVLARLFFLTGSDAYRDKAERVVATFSGELQRNFFPLAALINGTELLERALQVVILGEREREDTDALLRAVHGKSLPNLVLRVLPPGAALPPGHPAAGKAPAPGKATAFVCEGPVCSLPLTDAASLVEDLRRR